MFEMFMTTSARLVDGPICDSPLIYELFCNIWLFVTHSHHKTSTYSIKHASSSCEWWYNYNNIDDYVNYTPSLLRNSIYI